jgi:NADH-quinone oxidoreductase subunit G
MARGEKNYPAAAPGQVFDDAYSMNTIDICPVGALTSSSFRFKARVWEMNYSPSICTGCSKGCSTDVWVRDNEVLRLTPRHNPAVNDYWMCDAGRLDIQKYNQHRVSGTKIKGDIPVPFEYALQDAAALLKQHKGQTLWVASPHASLETLYALRKLAGNLGVQAADIVYAVPRDEAFADSLLKQADRSPNAASCVLLGFSEVTLEDLQAKAQAAELLYVCEDEAVANAFAGLYGSKAAIVQARRYFEGHANVDVLLPATESIEMFGTYINVDNIAQLSYMGKQIKQMSPDMWMSMPKSRLDAAGVAIDNWRHPEHIQDALPGWILLGQMHHLLEYAFAFKNHKEIFQQLKSEFAEVLEGVEIRKRARKEIFKISQLEFATGR